MYRIGIDVGSTYTKYCVLEDGSIKALFSEKTPVRQRDYFDAKLSALNEEYPGAEVVSCGYGRKNAAGLRNINELTALAKGCYHVLNCDGTVLDVGGQDTKLIVQEEGKLKEFFLNDKCAAGSGMFLTNTLELLNKSFEDIDLSEEEIEPLRLSSGCAVFAQSEIVELISDNHTEDEIIRAVINQIYVKASALLGKAGSGTVLLSGGLSRIPGIGEFASKTLERECRTVEKGPFLAAIGCALI
ncbi:MAG: acyl-CoA dehydratase activase [Lachnospiraceae bacterium]|nr:acyl-CoA dehydratase activase [Lachnospiraceae bacterium]